MLRGLDVCAGSGIGSLVFESIGLARTVCYVEKDEYCQRLIEQRIRDGWLADAPIWDDLKTFDGRPWRGQVDFIFGGIPCQPFSVAGKRGGTSDERDLWPDFLRVVCEVESRVILVENVPGLLSGDGGRWFGRLVGDLASCGYDAEWDVVSAEAVGAPHRRERVWIVAYASGAGRWEDARGAHADEGQDEGRAALQANQPDSQGHRARQVADPSRHNEQPDAEGVNGQGARDGRTAEAVGGRGRAGDVALANGSGRNGRQDIEGEGQAERMRPGEDGEAVADAEGQPIGSRLREGGSGGQRRGRLGDGSGEGDIPDAVGGSRASQPQPDQRDIQDGDGQEDWWWGTEPDVGRVAHGVASRVDRLRVAGNGWVPQVAAVVGRRIMRAMRQPPEGGKDE